MSLFNTHTTWRYGFMPTRPTDTADCLWQTERARSDRSRERRSHSRPQQSDSDWEV